MRTPLVQSEGETFSAQELSIAHSDLHLMSGLVDHAIKNGARLVRKYKLKEIRAQRRFPPFENLQKVRQPIFSFPKYQFQNRTPRMGQPSIREIY